MYYADSSNNNLYETNEQPSYGSLYCSTVHPSFMNINDWYFVSGNDGYVSSGIVGGNYCQSYIGNSNGDIVTRCL